MVTTRLTALQTEKRVKFLLADGSIVEPGRSRKKNLIPALGNRRNADFDRVLSRRQTEEEPATEQNLAQDESISPACRCGLKCTESDKHDFQVDLTAEIKADYDETLFAMDEELENLPWNRLNRIVDGFDEADRVEDFEHCAGEKMIVAHGRNQFCGNFPIDIEQKLLRLRGDLKS